MGGAAVANASEQLSFKQRMAYLTWPIGFIALYSSLAMFNYGYDVLVFSGISAMPDFNMRFGVCNEQGECEIPGNIISIMNSTPFLGKILGTWIASPMAEKYGRRPVFAFVIITSIIGVLLEATAVEVGQFTLGRIICYAMTGVCVLIVPAYVAETAPAPLRGLLIGQMQFQINFSQLVASLINLGTKSIPGKASWLIPICIQFLVPIALTIGYPFLVESPRWLISKGRKDDALVALRKLRKSSISQTELEDEIDLMSAAATNRETGKWKEIIQGTNRRRTAIAVLAMLGQQITGQAFLGQYGTLFYKQQGYSNSFELSTGSMALSVGAAFVTSTIVDSSGRRPLLLGGGLGQTIFLCIVGGTGTIANPNNSMKNLMVASMFLYGLSFTFSWAPLSYVILSEASSRRLIEKTNLVAITISVLMAFVVSFTVPYLIYPQYANLGAKVGFLYGSLAFLMAVLAYFFIPEMKGRSLEELDILFERQTPTLDFKKAHIDLTGELVARDKDSVERDVDDAKFSGSDIKHQEVV